MTERKTAAVSGGEQRAIIWTTSDEPLTGQLYFPASFTPNDKARAWEALRAIYEDVVNRPPSDTPSNAEAR